MNSQFVEAVKELLRTVAQSLIGSVVLSLGVVALGINTSTGEIAINWAPIVAILALGAVEGLKTGLVSATDKFLHKSGVATPLDMTALDGLKK